MIRKRIHFEIHIRTRSRGSSVSADSAPGDIWTAMRNFCDLYNLEYDMKSVDSILNRLNEIHDKYASMMLMKNVDKMLINLYADDSIQKENFCKSWIFLKESMKFSDELTTAVLANWYCEGAFSETNARDKEFPGVDNSGNDVSKKYTFSFTDGVAFGIMQWMGSRKELLYRKAEEMSCGVGSVNVQFALFKDEISKGGDYHTLWENNVLEIDESEDMRENMYSYTINFLVYIEAPGNKFEEEEQTNRKNTADVIYRWMVENNA